MKKKVIYKTGRNKFEIIEVTTPEEETAVKELNRDFERMQKADQRYRARFLSLDALYETSGFEPAASYTVDEGREVLYQFLHTAMEKIKPRYRQAIRLVFGEEKTQRQAAAEMGIKENTFSELLQRALLALKKEILKK